MSRLVSALAVLVLAAGGCSSGGDESGNEDRFTLTTPREDVSARDTPAARSTSTPEPKRRPVTRTEIRVIKGWADALRRGNVRRAVAYFRIPAQVSDGRPPVELTTRAQVRLFNASLPCGARLERTRRVPVGFVLATFVLTERPGPGRCGDGTGNRARTLFEIERGRIKQWLRATDP